MKESDLFPAVRDFLAEQGYTTYAEVKSCDVVGVRDDDLVIVELKTSLNLTLLRQAVDRQRISPKVYVAIPEPKRFNRAFRGSEKILKRLGLGLLTIYESPLRSAARVRFEPDHKGRINRRLRERVLKEVAGRSIDPNLGGSTGVTIYTAYRETAFALAYLLDREGAMLVKELRAGVGVQNIQPVLANNHYGWFERVSRGKYDLTETGRQALKEHPDLEALAARMMSGSG